MFIWTFYGREPNAERKYLKLLEGTHVRASESRDILSERKEGLSGVVFGGSCTAGKANTQKDPLRTGKTAG